MGVRTLAGTRNRRFSSSHPRLSGYVTLRGPAYGLRGLGTLGDDTSEAAQTLVAAGYNPLDVSQLVAQGATADQLYALPYGPGTTPADMSTGIQALNGQLTGSFRTGTPMQYDASGFLYPAAMASMGPISTLTSNAQPGTVTNALEYSAGPLGAAFTPGPPLPSGQPSAPSAVSSALTSLGVTAPQPTTPPASTFLQWFEANWIWIALLAGAAIVVPPLIKKL